MDVGELDRVVISVMQQLEHSEPLGFVVATSNLLPRLDPALVRRFDLAVEFPLPTKTERVRFARHRARALGIQLKRELARRVGTAKAYADVERVLVDEKRRLVLRGS
jgi:SpoVK/Ycf46/Vps4 family AAA+-type ATPase